MSKSSWGWYRVLYIVLAVLYIIAGATLTMNPRILAPAMFNMFGWLAVIYGVVLLVSYFMEANFKSTWTLISAVVLIILGFVVIFNPFRSMVIMGVLMAVGFIGVGIYKIYQAFFVKDLGVSSWWWVLILAACNIIIGLIMMFNLDNSGALITLWIGINLLVNGASDLALGIMGF